ncbi:MAG: TolC family protein [Myxococcales bacterium]|nr:TolC family protein [Myxococcales bacterium]
MLLVAAAVFAAAVFAAAPALAEPSAAANHEQLAAALASRVVSANPSITAMRARITALEQRVRRASAWPDPQVAVEYSNMPIDAWRPGTHPMAGIQFKLQQTFPFPGKVGLRQEVGRGRVRETRAALDELALQLRALVKRAYYKLVLVRQLRSVTEQHVKLVDQFTDVVRIKYQVGKAGQQDYLRLQVLAQKLRDDLKNFERDERALAATIDAALHRARTPIVTPSSLAAAAAPKATAAKLAELASAHRPALRQQTEVSRTRRLAARSAAREGYPDFTAWLGYRLRFASTDSGTDFIGVGVSVPIPFWYKRRAGSERHASEALARAALADRSSALDRIRGALGRELAAWRRAHQKARTYEQTLMPLAHKALDATFASYQVDRTDFAALYQAELQLLEFERVIRRARLTTWIARVNVEALVGKALRKAPPGLGRQP